MQLVEFKEVANALLLLPLKYLADLLPFCGFRPVTSALQAVKAPTGNIRRFQKIYEIFNGDLLLLHLTRYSPVGGR